MHRTSPEKACFLCVYRLVQTIIGGAWVVPHAPKRALLDDFIYLTGGQVLVQKTCYSLYFSVKVL